MTYELKLISCRSRAGNLIVNERWRKYFGKLLNIITNLKRKEIKTLR